MNEPVLPGYDDLVLLGFGSLGEVWRARHRRSGELVVVRRLVGIDREVLVGVRAAAAVVRSLPTEHLVRVRTTARSAGEDLLVLDHAAGGALRVDQPLAPGQVVTVVAPLAAALATAHAHGVVHGHLDVSSVLLSATGRPLLDGLGLAALREDGHDPTGALGPAADVWALGALALRLLTGQAPGQPVADLAPTAPVPLVAAIEAALRFDPAARPSAEALAEALLASCAAVPLPIRATVPEPRTGGRSGRGLPVPPPTVLLRSAVALTLLVGVVLLGVTWGRHTASGPGGVPLAVAPSPAPSPAPSSSVSGWPGVLAGLDAARARAFARADVDLLDAVYVAGSPVGLADRTVLSALADRGATVTGLRHAVDAVTALHSTTNRVELEVLESLAAHVLVERTGTVRVAAASPVTHVVVLSRTPVGWRIAAVR